MPREPKSELSSRGLEPLTYFFRLSAVLQASECFGVRRSARAIVMLTERCAEGACSFAHNEFWLNRDLTYVLHFRTVYAPQSSLSRDFAHFAERLPNCGQSRDLISGTLNVVKADDGNILGDAQTSVPNGADRPHRGNIVEGEKGSERSPRSKQFLRDFVAEFRRRRVSLKLHDETL